MISTVALVAALAASVFAPVTASPVLPADGHLEVRAAPNQPTAAPTPDFDDQRILSHARRQVGFQWYIVPQINPCDSVIQWTGGSSPYNVVMSKCVGSNSCMKGNGTRILTTSSPRQRFALKNADVKVGDSVYIEVSDNTKALLTASISVQYCGANPTISTAGSSIWAETSVTSPASSQSSTRTTTTTDTPAPDTAPKPKSHSGIGSGAIAGIVVAVLLLLAAFGAFMFFLHRRRKSRIDPLRSEFAMEHSPDVDPKPLMVSAPLALNHPPSAPAASVPESVSESDAPDAMTIRRQKSLEARQRYQPSSAASAAARSQPARSESGDTATSRGHQHTFSGDSSAVASAKNRLSIGSTATMSTTRPLPTPGSVRASSVPRIEVAQESDGGRLVNVPPPTYDPSWREQDEEEERQ